MNDIIAIVGVWLVSLISALVSIRQPKGVDWYTPISDKHKMIMTFINISIGLLVMILTFLIIPGQIWKTITISGIFIIIILYFSFPHVMKIIRKKSGNPNNVEKGISVEKGMSDEVDISVSENNTLLEFFSKFITIFNSMFFLMNIAYMLFIYENIKSIIEENESVIETIFTYNDVLLYHGIIIFWSTMSAIVITKNGWEFHKKINNNIETERRKKRNASFFTKRITDRNR